MLRRVSTSAEAASVAVNSSVNFFDRRIEDRHKALKRG
jgi:hypothetical protein